MGPLVLVGKDLVFGGFEPQNRGQKASRCLKGQHPNKGPKVKNRNHTPLKINSWNLKMMGIGSDDFPAWNKGARILQPEKSSEDPSCG